jgi:ubiquinone/menaquinone biosynthesis C-methylase UbiE
MGRAAWNLRATFYDQVFKLPFFRGIREAERGSFEDLFGEVKFRGARVLDVACGTGYYMELLQGGRVYGVDYSPEMLRVAKGKRDAHLVLADARHLPFKSASMDMVVCMGLLEYLKDKDAVLLEVRRVMKKDGYGVLSYSRKSLLNSLRSLLGSKVYPSSEEGMAISLNKCMLEWIRGRESLLQGQVLCRKP